MYTHDVQVRHYDSKIREFITFITDARLEDMELMSNLETCRSIATMDLLNALMEPKPIIEVPYSPFVAACVTACIKAVQLRMPRDRYYQYAFFHNDEETLKCIPERPAYCLQKKEKLIETMLLFPDINKIEIPYDALITEKFFDEQLNVQRAKGNGV
jgi:hypothetical protein